jgi:carbon-monoxide dehydrogenase small subunit
MNAQGKDTGGGGAQAGIVIVATPLGAGGTSLQAKADVFLTGRIAGFGRSLAGDVSRRMFADFARALDQAAAGEEPDVSARPPGAFALLLSTLVERVRQRVRRLSGAQRGGSRRRRGD